MLIILRSVGGFAGPAAPEQHILGQPGGLALSSAQIEQFRALVQAADFFGLPPTLKKTVPKSWDFLHTLQIGDQGRTHAVEFHTEAAPEALNILFDAVKSASAKGLPGPVGQPQSG